VGISKDDRDAFREALDGVKPLKPRGTVELRRARPAPKAGFSRAARDAMLEQSLNDAGRAELAEEIAFRRASVSEQVFRQLRRGQFSIEDEIDLHGLRRREAKSELQRFLAECAARRLGCVRVIHGKGARSGPDGPVLKASVQSWLAQWDDVLAFVSAGRRHGGSGAVYVLLRQR
jgi:DNA-nicking Smr family endonuclease